MEQAVKYRLCSIADIQIGYTFRSKLINQNDSNICVVQMKDLSDGNIIDTGSLIKTHLDKTDERHLIKRNDLVFRSRGQNNTAAIMESGIQNAVLAAPLFKIRINKAEILPEYLLWLINNYASQIWLASRREGSHGGMISKKTLEELEVFIPSVEKQREILQIDKLQKKEEQITGRLQALKNRYYSNVLLQAAKGE